jgi:adenosylhomocysteine nucleosidase
MNTGRPHAGRRVAEPPPPADVGIVAALPIEVGPFLASLRDVRKYASAKLTIQEGTWRGRMVALVVGGPGRAAAARAGNLLVAGHRPRWLLSAGFAGALATDLARGDVVLPDEVVDAEGNHARIEVGVNADAGRPVVRSGRLVTVDAVVRTASQKSSLRESSGAICVDMETSAVARLAAERGLRFLAVRVISDDAVADLPPEILSIVGPTGGYRVGAALGAIWKRPAAMKEMLRLRDHAHQAAEALARALQWVIPQLP